MYLSTYYLEYGSHIARLHRRRRRRAYAPTSNTANHDNHEKINSWVSFCFPYEYGAPLGGPSGRRSSTMKDRAYVCYQIYFNIFYMQESIDGYNTIRIPINLKSELTLENKKLPFQQMLSQYRPKCLQLF